MHLRICLAALLTAFCTGSAAGAEAPFSFERTPGKLSKEIVPQSYDIQLKPNIEKRTFTGSETVVIDVRKPTKTVALNANEMTISSAKLASTAGRGEQTARVAINAEEQIATLHFKKEIPAGTHQLTLKFAGKINESGQGLYYAVYDEATTGAKKTMLGTQMEATDARRMFPCWDEPAFRSKFRVTVTVPAAFTAVSNMPVESEKVSGALKQVRFGETPPMPSYLVVLCAGELDAIYGEADGVKIGIFTTKGKAEQGRYALESAEKMLKYFNEYFGEKYPLPKLDMIAMPSGFGGAMENWGGITYFESILLYDPAKSSEETKQRIFGVVAHEMAHQWFGDLVTMAWWDNLWLNEGFASWMGTKCTDHFNPQWQIWLRANAAKQRAMATDALSATHPIQQPIRTESEADSAFDEITYQKGQSFLRMLETYLGEEDFRAGIRSYMSKHQYSNTTTADLWNALGESSKKPVSEIAASWTEQPGFPVVSLTFADDAVTVSQEPFTVHQQNPPPLEWKIPVTHREVKIGELAPPIASLLDQKSAPLTTSVLAQPIKLNSDGIGYYRSRYPAAQFEKLLASVADLSEADKVNLVSDSWALVQAERGAIADYFKLVEAVRNESGLALWEQIATTLNQIDALHLGEKERAAFQSYARSLLAPAFARVGWEPKPGEEVATGLLRVKLIAQLGDLGDEGVIAGARERFSKFVADPKTLAPDLRPPVLAVVGRYADQKTWETLHQLGRETKNIEEKVNLYNAMAAALEPELVKKTLPISISGELPPARAIGLVTQIATETEQPVLAWEFTRTHRKELDAKLDSLGKVRFAPNVMRGFADAQRATELEQYMEQNYPAAAKSEVVKAAEEIRTKADLKQRVLPQIAQWIAAKTPVRQD